MTERFAFNEALKAIQSDYRLPITGSNLDLTH